MEEWRLIFLKEEIISGVPGFFFFEAFAAECIC